MYSGGPAAKVYDPNWNYVKEIPVFGSLEAVEGTNTFSVQSTQTPNAWLSSRIKVRDTENPIIVPKPQSK